MSLNVQEKSPVPTLATFLSGWLPFGISAKRLRGSVSFSKGSCHHHLFHSGKEWTSPVIWKRSEKKEKYLAQWLNEDWTSMYMADIYALKHNLYASLPCSKWNSVDAFFFTEKLPLPKSSLLWHLLESVSIWRNSCRLLSRSPLYS